MFLPLSQRQLIVGFFWRRKKYSRVYIERREHIVYLWSDWQYPPRQKDILDLARFIFWHQMQSNDLWACSLHRRNAFIEKKNQKMLQHAPSQQYSPTAQWFLRSINAFSPKKTEETEPFIPEGSGQTQIPHLQDGFNHKQTPKEKSDKSELWLTEYFFPTLAESHFRSARYIIKLNSIFKKVILFYRKWKLNSYQVHEHLFFWSVVS